MDTRFLSTGVLISGALVEGPRLLGTNFSSFLCFSTEDDTESSGRILPRGNDGDETRRVEESRWPDSSTGRRLEFRSSQKESAKGIAASLDCRVESFAEPLVDSGPCTMR